MVVHPAAPSDHPRVSVVVRTCAGRAGLLAGCLASVAAQDYPRVEVVVAEDGSRQAADTAARFRDTTPLEVRYLPLPKVGRCRAGNAGLEAAAGEWLNFLDDDDQLFPHHVSTLLTALAADPGSQAAYSRSLVVPTTLHALDPLRYTEHGRALFRGGPFSRWRLWEQNPFPIQACLFHRSLYERHGGFDPRFRLLEDWDLWVRYLSDVRVTFVNRVTSWFRVPGSAAVRDRRERALCRHVRHVQDRLGRMRLAFTAGELRAARDTMLDRALRDVPALGAFWSACDRGPLPRLVGRGGLRALGRVLRGANRVLGWQEAPPPSTPALANARALLATGPDDAAVSLTVREAWAVATEGWLRTDPERLALLALQNFLTRTGLYASPPVRCVQRLLTPRVAGGAALPGAAVGDQLLLDDTRAGSPGGRG
jgi:hypothetical protein